MLPISTAPAVLCTDSPTSIAWPAVLAETCVENAPLLQTLVVSYPWLARGTRRHAPRVTTLPPSHASCHPASFPIGPPNARSRPPNRPTQISAPQRFGGSGSGTPRPEGGDPDPDGQDQGDQIDAGERVQRPGRPRASRLPTRVRRRAAPAQAPRSTWRVRTRQERCRRLHRWGQARPTQTGRPEERGHRAGRQPVADGHEVPQRATQSSEARPRTMSKAGRISSISSV